MFLKDELSQCHGSLNSEKVNIVDEFRFSGVIINKDGNGKAEVKSSLEKEKNWQCIENSGEWEEACMMKYVPKLMYGYTGQDR